jgi:hypothetical protein
LAGALLRFSVITEVTITPFRQLELFPVTEKGIFLSGTINDLIEYLRHSYEQLVRDETLTHAVAMLEASIDKFIMALRVQPASTERMAAVLGVSAPLPEKKTGRARTSFSAAERLAVNRIGALILVNAMVFQAVLSKHEGRVHGLERSIREPNRQGALRRQWDLVLNEINYYPIFFMASEILVCLSSDQDLDRALADLLQNAQQIVNSRAALRHDLAGRIYHRLLEEAKYLGAYYTAIPSAALLLKLALRRDRYGLDWSDPKALAGLRVADLACGTGTLLMAAAEAIIDNHVRACVEHGKAPNLGELHHVLVEKIIHGYDVLASALHLTASTLTLRVPETPIDVTHLYRLPLGGPSDALGTLEFLERETANGTLFADPEHEQITGRKRGEKTTATIPDLDLCAMNPPFTRSVGCNLLFGNLAPAERARLQTKLKRLVKTKNVSASITAGLGSVFAALADRHLKRDGRLCLVLPRALISGVAWKPTRDLIAQKYNLEYLIVSHEPDHWNFSENTSLSEVLTVAHKNKGYRAGPDHRTVCVNLWRQPRTAVEALALAHLLLREAPPDLVSGHGVLELKIGDRKVGEAFALPWS